jgi:hypothetical protein
VEFLCKNIDSCVSLPAGEAKSPQFNDFQAKITKMNKDRDYKGILGYLLTVKKELLTLPISHKTQQLTIQRVILLILPLLKNQENLAAKKPQVYEDLKHITLEFCKMLEESQYPLSIKVNRYAIISFNSIVYFIFSAFLMKSQHLRVWSSKDSSSFVTATTSSRSL